VINFTKNRKYMLLLAVCSFKFRSAFWSIMPCTLLIACMHSQKCFILVNFPHQWPRTLTLTFEHNPQIGSKWTIKPDIKVKGDSERYCLERHTCTHTRLIALHGHYSGQRMSSMQARSYSRIYLAVAMHDVVYDGANGTLRSHSNWWQYLCSSSN